MKRLITSKIGGEGPALIILHSLFWIVVYFFFISLKAPLLGLSYRTGAFYAIKDVAVVAIIFYFVSYYVIPQLLLKRRYLLVLLCLILIYYFYALCTFLEFLLLPKLIEIPGRGYQAYAQRVLSEGIVGVFIFRNSAEILLDMTYMLSPALIVRLVAALVSLRTQAIKLERDNLNLELAFLKSQINPHFLFNTLNNVYSLALHKSDSTAEVILKLSDLMRYTLYDSNTSKIMLDKEIQFFRNYVELERIRHNSAIKISFDVDVEVEDYYIAPLIIFPFIENAFKHGINSSMRSAWVTILLKAEGATLNVKIVNSRLPVKGSSSKVGGIGISNTKKRLELLYPQDYTLEIQEEESFFSVYLAIQLSKSEI